MTSPLPSLRRDPSQLSLRELEWASVLLPLAFLGLYYYLMLGPLHRFFHAWYGFVVLWVALAAAVLAFAMSVFRAFRRMQSAIERLERDTRARNERLLALQDATLELSRATRVDAALHLTVTLSARLVAAERVVLAVLDPDGRVVRTLASDGADGGAPHPAAATAEPPPIADPDGDGADPAGRSGAHVVRGAAEVTLVAPVVHLGRTIGVLRFPRHPDAPDFDGADEQIATMFAAHAAVVIANARLYDEVQALAVERERQHIAREMHDGLAQVLGFVNTKAQAAEQYLRGDRPEAARREIAELSEAARAVYRDIREGIVALRTQSGGERDLAAVIDEYVEEFRGFAHLPVTVRWVTGDGTLLLTPPVEVQLLRIVQEALANVRRHAHASRAEVAFRRDGDALEVAVIDDGRGFDPRDVVRGEWPRLGLQTMRERAQVAGGTLTIDSTPGEGTVVRARFPRAFARSVDGAAV